MFSTLKKNPAQLLMLPNFPAQWFYAVVKFGSDFIGLKKS
jgi:hypothetical protein